ncbi:MAG: PH domain-containing protein [Candidatus Aegiribacteria sp.]
MGYEDIEFNAPWGTMLKVISTLATLLLLGVFVGMALSGRASTPLELFLYLLFPLLILVVALLFVVRGYRLTGGGLSVRRLFWDTRVELGVVRRVEHDPKAMTGAIRTWGNGGLFSFSGRFRSGRLGSFRAWVNDYGNCVIIETLSGTLVVSPGDPERFAEEVRNRFWSGS